jgi:hypothetical protein
MSDRPYPLLTLSRRFAAVVGRVPPFGYGVAFLSMIPLYALIYWFISPNEFYHQTVAHEEPFYRRVADLEQQFRAVLFEDMRLAYQGDAVVSVYRGSAEGMPGEFVRMVFSARPPPPRPGSATWCASPPGPGY